MRQFMKKMEDEGTMTIDFEKLNMEIEQTRQLYSKTKQDGNRLEVFRVRFYLNFLLEFKELYCKYNLHEVVNNDPASRCGRDRRTKHFEKRNTEYNVKSCRLG